MTATTLQQRASEARKHFVLGERNDGTKFWSYDQATTPQWVNDMTRTAHNDGEMSPDDYRYQFIVDALDALAEHEDPDGIELEADIYTSDLMRWLSSRADRYGYCDEVMEDYGGEFKSIIDIIMEGQVREKREVLDSVRNFIEAFDMSDGDEDTEDDGSDS